MATVRYFSVGRDEFVEVDTSTGELKTYSDETYETIVSTEAATQDELTIATGIEIADVPIEAAIKDRLAVALTSLRAATQDGHITQAEANSLRTVVIPALEGFRDMGKWDDETGFLCILVLAQTLQSVFITGAQQAMLFAQLAGQVNAIDTRVGALES